MAKFNVGDRVIRKDNGRGVVKGGTLGTIIEVFDSGVMVRWDDNLHLTRVYRGDFLNNISLVGAELLPTLDAAIALYQLACERFEAAQLSVERAKADIADAKLAIGAALEGES